MQRITLPWLTAAAASMALAGTAALAQAPAAPDTQPGLTKGEIKAQRDFKMLDFDGDGKLSRKEVQLFPRLAAAFDDADTNKDGFVSNEDGPAFAGKSRAERDRARAARGGHPPAEAGSAAPAAAEPAVPAPSPFAPPR